MVRAAYVEKVVDVPDGVQVTLEGNTLKVKGPLGEVERRFVHPRLKMTVEDSQVKVYCELPKKKKATRVKGYDVRVFQDGIYIGGGTFPGKQDQAKINR